MAIVEETPRQGNSHDKLTQTFIQRYPAVFAKNAGTIISYEAVVHADRKLLKQAEYHDRKARWRSFAWEIKCTWQNPTIHAGRKELSWNSWRKTPMS
ncbi:hypothetical protein M514_28401 [Trichuris suis]|uniref:Uncharacterized protein n=1 Tax=Trichuris suis TaxID=68888 RepID=A0A085MQC2_9BILA|nr:hypothetical protein M514_28401 [Trichuris suis]